MSEGQGGLGEENILGRGSKGVGKDRCHKTCSGYYKRGVNYLEVGEMKRTFFAFHCQPTENVGLRGQVAAF